MFVCLCWQESGEPPVTDLKKLKERTEVSITPNVLQCLSFIVHQNCMVFQWSVDAQFVTSAVWLWRNGCKAVAILGFFATVDVKYLRIVS